MTTTIKSYLQAPQFEDKVKNHQAYMLNIILIIMLSAVVVVGGIYLIAQTASGTSSATVIFLFIRLSLGIVASFILMRWGYVYAGGVVLVALFLWFSYFQLPDTDVLSSSYVLTFVLPIVMATLVLGSRFGVLTALISSALLAIAARNELTSVTELLLSLWTFYTGIYLSLALLLRLSSNRLDQTLDNLDETNSELQKSHAEMEERIQERTNDLALAAEISRGLAQVRDLELLLANAAERIRHRFGLYYTQIYLIDNEGRNLDLRAGTGSVGQELLSRNHRLPLNASSINGAAAINGEPVIVADTEKSPFFRRNPLLPDTRSEMAVPLIAGEDVVGVIDLQSSEPEALSESNIAAFEIIAGQLAIAIENARLIRDTERSRKELEHLARLDVRANWDSYMDAIQHGEFLGYSFADGEIKPVEKRDELLVENGRGLRIPITLAGETIGNIILDSEEETTLKTEEADMMHTVASQVSQQLENLRLLNEAERYQREAEAAINRQIREGWQTFLLDEAQDGFFYDQSQVRPLANAEELPESVFSADLRVQNEQIGKLEIVSSSTGNEIDMSTFLPAIATRLSSHIENIRLNDQTQRALSDSEARSEELEILNEMSRALSSQVDVDSVVETIYEYTSKIMDASNFYVALYDAERNEIEFIFDITKGTKRWHAGKRQAGAGLTEHLLKTREPLLMANNVVQHLKELGIEQIGGESESWLGAPLVIGDQASGVIGLQSYTTPNTYNEQHLRLLTAVASQAAIAIESARLFEQIQGRARQEQILREVTARVHAAVDAKSILRTAAKEINRSLGLETFVYLESAPDSETEIEPAKTNGHNGRDSAN